MKAVEVTAPGGKMINNDKKRDGKGDGRMKSTGGVSALLESEASII